MCFAMNTRMPYHWKKHMFGMQPSNVGGIPWVADRVKVQELENWPNFWHFCVIHWGGFMRQHLMTMFEISKH